MLSESQIERAIATLEGIRSELEATRKVLETLPDRRDLVESFVAAALVLSPDARTPEQLGIAVRKVSDAVWSAIHEAKVPHG